MKKKRAPLPLDHPVRQQPKHLQLYQSIIDKSKVWMLRPYPDDNLDFRVWIHTQARKLNILAKDVDRVIELTGLYPGGALNEKNQ